MARRRSSGRGKRTRETHDPGTALPVSLKDQLVLEGNTESSRSPGQSAHVTRKQERKRLRRQKRRAGHEASVQWRNRQRQQLTIPRVERRKEEPAPQSSVKHSKKESDETSKKSKKGGKRKRSQVDGNGGPDGTVEPPDRDSVEIGDPDVREARRLEKLLGIDRKRKRKASKGGDFSYADVFGEEEDDMVDLLRFCEDTIQRNRVDGEVRRVPEENSISLEGDSEANSEAEVEALVEAGGKVEEAAEAEEGSDRNCDSDSDAQEEHAGSGERSDARPGIFVEDNEDGFVQEVAKAENFNICRTNNPDDPDMKEARRLEKLLRIDCRKKRKAAKDSKFSYSDIFGEEEGDLVDLLNFCDETILGFATKGDEFRSDLSSTKNQEDIEDHVRNEDDRNHSGREDPEEDEAETEDRNTSRSASMASEGSEGESIGSSSGDSGDAPPWACDAKGLDGREGREALNVDQSPSKYVPPGARGQGNAKLRVSRRSRGLLNRVADANASGIAESIVQVFESSWSDVKRHEIANIYASATLDSVRDGCGIGYVNPYVQSHAAIASHLASRVEESILATLLVALVRRIDQELDRLQTEEHAEDILVGESAEKNDAFGYVVLLCSLYERGAVSAMLIYDLVKMIAEPLTTGRLELLLGLLRQVGALLRQDDPSSLKDMIEFIHCQSDKFSGARQRGLDESEQETQNVKLQVMLDLIDDIKNNKQKKSTVLERKAKFAWAGTPQIPLFATIRDLLDDDFTSKRWWDGDAPAHRESQGDGDPVKSASRSVPHRDGTQAQRLGPDLASLASSLRLNTDYRKALFKAIMSSVSVSDAFERLERMAAFNTKSKHDRDTALVILHCCSSEKSFNPFYAFLAERMCCKSRSLRFTFEFALWDIFKTITGTSKTKPMSKRKASNYGQLLAHLWNVGALSLSVLRCVSDFEDCGEGEKSFYVDAISFLFAKLKDGDEEAKTRLFYKLQTENWNGIEAFRVTLALFLRRTVQPLLSKAERSILGKAIRILEQ